MKVSNMLHKLPLWSGIVAPAYLLSIVLFFGINRHEYNYLSQTVSELGTPGQPYSIWFRISFIIIGVLIVLFAYALHKEISDYTKYGSVYLGSIGILNILGGIFPIDLANVNSASSIIHMITGVLLMIFFIFAFYNLYCGIKKNNHFKNLGKLFLLFGGIGLLGILITISIPSCAGLGQRIFYCGFCSILWLISIHLLKRSPQ